MFGSSFGATRGEAMPVRTATVDGHAVHFYSHPAHLGRPWVCADSLFDAIGLDPARRASFVERNGLDGPAASNLVRAPGRLVSTISRDAALHCVNVARHAAAITAETAAALHLVLAE